MASWKWISLPPKDGKCEGCKKPLRQDAGAGLIEFTESARTVYSGPFINTTNWHTHCLLNKLVAGVESNTGQAYGIPSMDLSP